LPYHHLKTQHEFVQTLDRIEQAIYSPIAQLHIEAWITPEPVPFAERQSGQYRELAVGESWGQLWDCAWFHFTGNVPMEAEGKAVSLLIDLSGEGCVVDAEGCPILGLTTVSYFDHPLGRPGKRVVPLTHIAQGNEKIDLWVDAGCNDLFGRYHDSGTIKAAHIALHNEEMEQLYYDFAVLHELMTQLSSEKARFHRIMTALRKACYELNEFTTEEAVRARAMLAGELAKTGGTPSLRISAIGHAHLDLAWLWPIRETIRKGARSFATVLALMERYPDYIFGASQPQLYQWIKEYYPALYAKMRARITEGRWETQGAMWVEPDTNLPGGEALVRQLLYGKRFFRQEFGTDPKMLWIPDVFGYSASLPQILKKAGVDYFLTIKLSWNKFNTFPHHTFLWQGLDGSRVLAHMPPEGNFNSSAAPRALIATEKNFADKAISEYCALSFGIGDGGGGPGIENLECLAREKNLEGLPPVTQEPMETFFQRLTEDASDYKIWNGELYLETHQGTYTSQARNKRFNRKMELALRETEFMAVLASVLTEYSYPTTELHTIWQEMLLYQFHDILPGSSITRVYDESLARYQQLYEQTQQLLQQAEACLIREPQHSEVQPEITVFNSLSWARHQWLRIEDQWFNVTVPAMGYIVLNRNEQPNIPSLLATTDTLENDLLKISVADDGSIQSIFDKEQQREMLEPGSCANRLAVYIDDGDAWDISINYTERPPRYFKLASTEAQIDGSQAIVKHSYHFGQSTLQQHIVLTAGSRRIDFVTTVDWQERNKMLRTSFPVAIHATEATCDIQFGSIKRPTHHNTSWDMAKYEICAHKWIDISQWDYGVALLNDCKYGHKVAANVLDLNLLRSPGHPDPQADCAQHEFTYALYPHPGNHISGGVIHEGYELNVPLRYTIGKPDDKATFKTPHDANAFVTVDTEHVIIEAIKKAEDSNDIILRLYEAIGAHTSTTLALAVPIVNVWSANLLEEPEAVLEHQQHTVALTFKPFEILTLRVKLA
jgi:alpha-mannosidase